MQILSLRLDPIAPSGGGPLGIAPLRPRAARADGGRAMRPGAPSILGGPAARWELWRLGSGEQYDRDLQILVRTLVVGVPAARAVRPLRPQSFGAQYPLPAMPVRSETTRLAAAGASPERRWRSARTLAHVWRSTHVPALPADRPRPPVKLRCRRALAPSARGSTLSLLRSGRQLSRRAGATPLIDEPGPDFYAAARRSKGRETCWCARPGKTGQRAEIERLIGRP